MDVMLNLHGLHSSLPTALKGGQFQFTASVQESSVQVFLGSAAVVQLCGKD